MRQRGLPGSFPNGTTGLFQHSEAATSGGVPARPAEASSLADDFEEFWRHFPRHVKKLAARKAYEKARKLASAETILAGAMLYARTCPQEEQFIAHPTSWLNQGRWDDEIGSVRRTPVRAVEDAEDWYDQCGRLHGHACGLDRWKHITRVQRETEPV